MPSNRSEGEKPWLRDLAISFVTDAVHPMGTLWAESYRCLSYCRGVGGRCEKISLVTLIAVTMCGTAEATKDHLNEHSLCYSSQLGSQAPSRDRSTRAESGLC